MKKIYLIIVLLIVTNTSFSQITITTQAELNALSSTSVIPQDLIITTVSAQDSSTMVTDLSPLMGVDSILGNLEIRHTAITNLSGLSNIKYVDEVWIYENTVLKSLETLGGPQRINRLRIYNNPYIVKCSDFSFSKKLFTLTINNNHRLEVLDISFENIEPSEFTISVSVFENPKLKSIRLNDPSSEMGVVLIDSNQILESVYVGASSDTIGFKLVRCEKVEKVSGFQDVKRMGVCWVHDNPQLNELCFIKQTLQREGISWLKVENNAPGANSEAEIMATDCSNFNTGINELNHQKLTLYPNPAHNEVFLEIPNKLTQYQIYDMSGKIVQQGNVEANGRIGLAMVSGGMYILLVGEKRSKLVIQ